MKTVVLDARANQGDAVAAASELLSRNEVVAIPTETVYGLAGNALDTESVTKIFEAKSRPAFDPLIVHIGSADWLSRLIADHGCVWSVTERLIQRFWPGPLTILFPKSAIVPDLVTAGLDDVAIRMPSHPLFLAVLKAFGNPLAAPSANRFGRVSPTQAAHVVEELEGQIPLILDGGTTQLGVESTIVRIIENRIQILRPGPVTEEELARIAPASALAGSPGNIAPGQALSHYAPAKPVRIFDAELLGRESQNRGFLCWGPIRHSDEFAVVRSLSESRDLRIAAQRLFGLIREMDRLEIEEIVIDPVPETGLGKAIMNRIRRASAPRSAGSHELKLL
jgi:L-threonylcarbamoyladenylate synthase